MPNPGWKLLTALGVDPKAKVRKAVITIEVGRATLIELTQFGEWDADSAEFKSVVEAFELIPRELSESVSG